jgi:hypothetical protein
MISSPFDNLDEIFATDWEMEGLWGEWGEIKTSIRTLFTQGYIDAAIIDDIYKVINMH